MVDENGYRLNEVDVIENTKESLTEYHNQGWGRGEYILTKEHMKALNEGKAIGVYDGEYTNVFILKDDEK